MSALSMPDREPWSARLGAGEASRERVVFVPPGRPLREGLAALRPLVSEGATARLIARGATDRSQWPDWLRAASAPVVLTELDAYRPLERAAITLELVPTTERWLAWLCAGAVDELPVERVFWASAQARVLMQAFIAWPLVRGLLHHHAGDELLCTDGDWAGVPALERLVAEGGGKFWSARERRAPFRLALPAWVLATALGALGRRGWEWVRERPSRARLRVLRDQTAGAEPSLWLGMLGDWPRSSRHVLEGVGSAAQARGERVGVLLQNSLQPGLRIDGAPRGHQGRRIFPALDAPQLAGQIASVEQCAAAEDLPTLARHAVAMLARAAHMTARLVRSGPTVELGPMPISLAPRVSSLARLLTFDVLRAREAAEAARAAARRRSFRGARIVWPHASLANVAAPDLILQAAGAVTYELAHGALADPIDMVIDAFSTAGVKLLWTEAEVRYLERFAAHQERIGGLVPREIPPAEPRARRPDERIRLLALTNYLASTHIEPDPRELLCYQRAFFDALLAALDGRGQIEVRWRPHPSDDRGLVEAMVRDYAVLGMTLSLERGALQAELRAADVLVTTVSTSIVEASVHPLPMFVHDIPLHDPASILALIPPERRFRDGRELRAGLDACLALDAQARLGPERELRRRFFGPAGAPRPLADLFWPGRAQARVL